jgi:glycosyltransferase involved in cell wall biosynthesis
VTTDHREKLAIVVQRYGRDITGGAEAHARAIALRLCERYKIDVYTTCAIDNRHWGRALPAGESFDEQIRVLRFEQEQRGSLWARHTPLSVHRLYRSAQRGARSPNVPDANAASDERELRWLAAQGPACAPLIEALGARLDDYRAVLVYSLRYWTAVQAVRIAREKALLLPTLHDEKAMYRAIYREALSTASTVLFNTDTEQTLADRLYGRCYRRADIVGIGIDAAQPDANAIAQANKAVAIGQPYVVYTGRINAAKGCDQLIVAFEKFRREQKSATQLVLLGKQEMKLPQRDWLIAPGFVDDTVRDGVVAGALALVLPSKFESLSLSTLEAMAFGVPVVVNGECDVLKQHVAQSRAGFSFVGVDELARRLSEVSTLDAQTRALMATNARAYVRAKYSWPAVLQCIERAIDTISPAGKR